MLSIAEIQYLQGQKKVSKSYERKLRCLIRKKLGVLQKELPLLSKLFVDNFKNFSCKTMNTNEGLPLSTKQEKKISPELYPKVFEVKRATKFSNLESNDIQVDAGKDVKCHNLDIMSSLLRIIRPTLLNLVMSKTMALRNIVIQRYA